MENNNKFSVIITAGGTSSRFGLSNKLLEKLNDKSVLEVTVSKFIDFKSDSGCKFYIGKILGKLISEKQVEKICNHEKTDLCAACDAACAADRPGGESGYRLLEPD